MTVLLVAVAATSACDKNAVQQIAGPQAGGANVMFHNFAVGSPNVNFYVNDVKTTGVGATGCYILTDANREACTAAGIEATTGTAYGGAGAGAWYVDLAPGQITIQGRITAATDKGLPISNAVTTIEQGKFYSFYQSGTYNTTTKTADSFVIEDPIPPVNFGTAYVRFVHASGNANPMTLYATNTTSLEEIAVGSEVTYKTAGTYVAVPAGTYNLAARYAGTTTNVFTRASVSFFNGRVYTITARGNVGTASTMLLDNTTNR